jgi:hypothetical protein
LTDFELWNLVNTAFGEMGLAHRERLAADELATTLVARRREVHRKRTSGRSTPGVRNTSATPDDIERRAAAFRTMAGVGV